MASADPGGPTPGAHRAQDDHPGTAPTDTDVRRLRHLIEGAGSSLGATTLLCLEGRSGSGKTSLAGRLLRAWRDRDRAVARDRHASRVGDDPVAGGRHGPRSIGVLSVDQCCPGWSGLPLLGTRLCDDLLEPWSRGAPAAVRTWDWRRDRPGPRRTVPFCDVLILEGVGAYDCAMAPWVDALVWLEAPETVRRDRARRRDRGAFEQHWEAWVRSEDDLHRRHRTKERADLVLDTTRYDGPAPGSAIGAATADRRRTGPWVGVSA